MGFAHDGGVDVVLTHPVRAVRPLNFIPSRIRGNHYYHFPIIARMGIQYVRPTDSL